MENQCARRVLVLAVYSKEYNLKHRHQTHHTENYNTFQGQLRAEKIWELLAGLRTQQSIFERWATQLWMLATFATFANEIASTSKLFSDSKFVKTYMLFICDFGMVFWSSWAACGPWTKISLTPLLYSIMMMNGAVQRAGACCWLNC